MYIQLKGTITWKMLILFAHKLKLLCKCVGIMATQKESRECKPNGNDSIIIPTHSTVELREPLLASDEDYQ